MNLIERVEISYFRSFKKTEIYDLKDLNIFSGANDSWKSNVLRALNLFFNDEISPWISLDIERDFNFVRNQEIQNQEKWKMSIDITVYFNWKSATRYRGKNFSIKKRWNSNGVHSTTVYKDDNWSAEIYSIYSEAKIYKDKISQTEEEKIKFLKDVSQKLKSINRFLNKIFFFYVPAIKDEKFFSHIFWRLLSTIKENEEFLEEKEISDTIKLLENSINNETKIILDQFRGIQMSFNVPKRLEDFFSAFDIWTIDKNSSNQSSITIKSRWDWIQAKLIPYLLELLEINQNKKTKDKNDFIWGFEEPENSFEYKSANDLALKFKDNYSLDKNRQIFLTTHSFNFLSLEWESVSKYRVFRWTDYISQIYWPIWSERLEKQSALLEDENVLKLEEELGVFTLNKDLEKIYLIREKEKELLKQSWLDKQKIEFIKRKLEEDNKKCLENLSNLESQIEEYKKPILYVEDEYNQIYKIAYLKLNDIDCDINTFEQKFKDSANFIIRTWKSAWWVSWLLRTKDEKLYDDKKIIWLFDFDKEGRENFHRLSDEKFWKENVSWSLKESIKWDKEKGFYKKRQDEANFYAMLLPIPQRLSYSADLSWSHFVSYVEIENLLPENFLVSNNFVDVKSEWCGSVYKIKDNSKNKLWEKLFSLTKTDFQDFDQLFKQIAYLFSI